MQKAAQDDDVSGFFPSLRDVNLAFSDEMPATPDEASAARDAMPQTSLMLDLFRQRLSNPVFQRWMGRDVVNGRDLVRALDRLQERMHAKVVALGGRESVVQI